MVVAQQMEQAMNEEHAYPNRGRDAERMRLAACRVDRDDDVAEQERRAILARRSSSATSSSPSTWHAAKRMRSASRPRC